MAACDKVTPLKFKNRVGVINDTDWIAGMESENKTKIKVKNIGNTNTTQKAKMMKMKTRMNI